MAFETPMSESPSNQGPDRTVMPHIEQVNAETAVATPNPPPEDAPAPIAAPAQAAPAKSAAPSAASARHPSPQPPRMANPRDGLLWADAMTAVSQEMTAGLDALPPALRKQEAMRAQLLRSVARDITARASAAGVPRRIVVVPKT
jgi:hypothetical protein